jgi:hypothetical protein
VINPHASRLVAHEKTPPFSRRGKEGRRKNGAPEGNAALILHSRAMRLKIGHRLSC